MNTIHKLIAAEGEELSCKAAPGKRNVRLLAYELISNLAMKQYVAADGSIRFDGLLSIALKERLPGLIKNYGLERVHHLVMLVLQECCDRMAVPESAKLSNTAIAAFAGDIARAACEDQLGIEDLIVFFELVKGGKWGILKGRVTPASLMQKLEQYRAERSAFYFKWKEAQEAAYKKMPALPRIGDTRSIGEIMQQAEIISIAKRKSG